MEEIDAAVSETDQCFSVLSYEVICIRVGVFDLDVSADEIVVGPTLCCVVSDFLVEGDAGHVCC